MEQFPCKKKKLKSDWVMTDYAWCKWEENHIELGKRSSAQSHYKPHSQCSKDCKIKTGGTFLYLTVIDSVTG